MATGTNYKKLLLHKMGFEDKRKLFFDTIKDKKLADELKTSKLRNDCRASLLKMEDFDQDKLQKICPDEENMSRYRKILPPELCHCSAAIKKHC